MEIHLHHMMKTHTLYRKECLLPNVDTAQSFSDLKERKVVDTSGGAVYGLFSVEGLVVDELYTAGNCFVHLLYCTRNTDAITMVVHKRYIRNTQWLDN